jgi:vacuolar protein sorting-associated protein 13A/C
MQWEDLMARPAQVVVCLHSQANEPAWRLQAWAQHDVNDPVARYVLGHRNSTSLNKSVPYYSKYPKITLRLRAPIELENLLPYNLQYRIFDKQLDQNWSSYLRQGGLMPVHSVELRHLVMLNVHVQDTCMASFMILELILLNGES